MADGTPQPKLSAREEPEHAPANPDTFTVIVRGRTGELCVYFLVRMTTLIAKVIRAYETRIGAHSKDGITRTYLHQNGERVDNDETCGSSGLLDGGEITCVFELRSGVQVDGYRGPDLHIKLLMGHYTIIPGRLEDGAPIFQLNDDAGKKMDAFLQRSSLLGTWRIGTEKVLANGGSFIDCYLPPGGGRRAALPIGLRSSVWVKLDTQSNTFGWLFDLSLQITVYQSPEEKVANARAFFARAAQHRQSVAAGRRIVDARHRHVRSARRSAAARKRAPRSHCAAHDQAIEVLAQTPYLDILCTMTTLRDLGTLLVSCEELAGMSKVVWSKAKGRRIIGCPVHTSVINVGAELCHVDSRSLRQVKFWKEGTVRSGNDVRMIFCGGNPALGDIISGADKGLTRVELDQLGTFKKQKVETRACMLVQPNARAHMGRDGRIASLLVPFEVHAYTPLDEAVAQALETAWLAAAAASESCDCARFSAIALRDKAFEARDSLGYTPAIPVAYLVTSQSKFLHGLRIWDYSSMEWFSLFAAKTKHPGRETWTAPILSMPTDDEIDKVSALYEHDLRDPANVAITSALVEAWRELHPSGPLGKRTFAYHRHEGDRGYGPCGAIYGMAWLPVCNRLAVGFQDGRADVVLVNLDTREVTQELEVKGCCQVVHALPAPWALLTSGCNTLQVWAPAAADPTQVELVHSLSDFHPDGFVPLLHGLLTVLHSAALILELADNSFVAETCIRVLSIDPLKVVRVIAVGSPSQVSGLVDVGGGRFAGCVITPPGVVTHHLCEIRIWDASNGSTLRRFGTHRTKRMNAWNATLKRTSWKLTADNRVGNAFAPTPLLLWNDASKTLLAEYPPQTEWKPADADCVWSSDNSRELAVILLSPKEMPCVEGDGRIISIGCWRTFKVRGNEAMGNVMKRFYQLPHLYHLLPSAVMKHRLRFSVDGIRVMEDDTPDSLGLVDQHIIKISLIGTQTQLFGQSFTKLKMNLKHKMFASSVIPAAQTESDAFERIPVSIVDLTGQRTPMLIHPECKVKQIKEGAAELCGCPSGFIRLVLNGEVLEDDELSSLDFLQKGDTIHIAEPTRVHIPSRIESWDIATGECIGVCVGLGSDELPHALDFDAGFRNLALRARAPLIKRERWAVQALDDGSLLTLGNGGELQRWL